MILTFDHVTKFYGAVIGVNNISCRIGPGITGLFGANGAGKSTLMKLASGQLRPSQGEVRLGDTRAWSFAAKRLFGYSPDLNSFYEEMTGREFVYVMARMYGMSKSEARDRTEAVLVEVGMADRAGRRIAGCSHGMRQRIKLAQALIHDPPVLLLDEPLSGIDPGGRREISQLLVEQGEKGKTILVSSHILVETENLADSVLIIARGRIVASGTLREIRAMLEDRPLTVEIASEDARRLASLLVNEPDVRGIELRSDSLVVKTRNPQRFFGLINDLIAQNHISVRKLQALDAGADAVFNYLQQGAR